MAITTPTDGAFPAAYNWTNRGLSKREWFAGQVLIGLSADLNDCWQADAQISPKAVDSIAKAAVMIADRVIAALRDESGPIA